MNPAVINAVFGAKIKIIDGYKGSGDLTIALERGEIGGMSATWSNLIGNHPGWLSENKVRPIVQIGMKRLPAYDKVPLLQEIGRSPEERELIELMPLLTTAIGYSVLAPPGEAALAKWGTASRATPESVFPPPEPTGQSKAL